MYVLCFTILRHQLSWRTAQSGEEAVAVAGCSCVGWPRLHGQASAGFREINQDLEEGTSAYAIRATVPGLPECPRV